MAYNRKDISTYAPIGKYILPLAITAIFCLFASTCYAEITETSFYTNSETKGRNCADGKYHNLDKELCAASWDFKLHTVLRISTLDGSKSVLVLVVDRGPSKRLCRRGRRLDLAKCAFKLLGDTKKGLIKVKVEEVS